MLLNWRFCLAALEALIHPVLYFISLYSTFFFTRAVSLSMLITVQKTNMLLCFPAMHRLGFTHSHPCEVHAELPGLLLLDRD